MDDAYLKRLFHLEDRVAVVTGGSGVLGRALCLALARLGAYVVVLGRDSAKAERVVGQIRAVGGKALALTADVTVKSDLETAAATVLHTCQRVDILINAAGGNRPEATTAPARSFFDLPPEVIRTVVDLNWTGTVLATQVFGRVMAAQGEGVILNIVSAGAFRPLTRVPAYAAAKAAVWNLTQWLAVYMAQEYSPRIRVNALAPGFFLTEQNRYLLVDEVSGELTPRGRRILEHTPMARFGAPDDLIGAVVWLVSPASAFVTGIVVPVDGGFLAYGGV
ncbi:MAG: SDR family oxidoreductase [Anaerolineae bacterium]|nr:SDR family oxidoreductase [Caldilineales bacterium]MDW8270348.1 SDR family oxidoreductase [Anaerolineae bacterium]